MPHLLSYTRLLFTAFFLSCTIFVSAQSPLCKTTTYKMEIPAPAGGSIELRKLQTTHERKILGVIQETSAGGIKEGKLALFESDGTISATRKIAVNGGNVRLFDSDILDNGDILAAGVLEDGSNRSFLLRCGPDFSVIWTKIYDNPSTPENVLIWGKYSEGVFFLATHCSDYLNVIGIEPSGIKRWAKEIKPEGLIGITGMVSAGWTQLQISTNVQAEGALRMNLLELDKSNGNIRSSTLINKTGTAQKILEHVISNERTLLLSYTENNDGSRAFARTLHYDPLSTEIIHSFEIPAGYLSASSTATLDNAGDAIVLNNPLAGKMSFIRIYNDYNSKPWKTREYDVPNDLQVVSIASGADAGYLIGSNTISRNKLLFLKTDSIGSLPGCGFNEVSYPSSEIYDQKNPAYSTILDNNVAVEATAIATTTPEPQITTSFSCKQLFCPSLPVDVNCTPSFHKTYRTTAFNDLPRMSYTFANGSQVILAGQQTRSTLPVPKTSISLELLDENGNYTKGIVINNAFSHAIDGTDGEHFMLTTLSNHPSGQQYTFTLFTANLDLIWSKSIVQQDGLFAAVPGVLRASVQKDEEGNYYAYGVQLGIWTPSRLWVYKMDANGNKIWEKIHDLANRMYSNCAMTITKESLIFAIDCFAPASGVSAKLDKKTGGFIHGFTYNTSYNSTSNAPVMKYTQGYILYSGNTYQGDYKMLLFDSTGKPLKQHVLPDFIRSQAAYIGEGEMTSVLSYYTGATQKVILKVDTALQILFARQYTLENTHEIAQSISVSNTGSMNEIGWYYSLSNYPNTYFKKYNPSGILGTCGFTSLQPLIRDVDPAPVPLTNFAEAPVNSFAVPSDFQISGISEGQQIGSVPCSAPPVNACNSVSIQGPDKVCSVRKEYEFSALTASGCEAVINWRPEQEGVSIKRTGSNTVAVTFYKTGTFRLHASINTGCDIFSDHFDVLVQASDPSTIITAEKKMLCKTDSSMLTAQPGFSSYTWSDGSHNQELKVKAPGKYYVDVVNACMATVSDTLVIGAWNELIPDLGPERNVCEKSVFNLELNGFAQYDWIVNNQPAGKQKSISFPVIGNSTLIAEVKGQEGCVLRDTLEINAMPVPALYLGNDTAICTNATLIVSANPGFVDYNWSNGAGTNQIEVKTAGTYSITATAANGCIAKDTIELLQLLPLPEIKLGNDGILCAGDQKRLDAGIHTAYSWHNGSTDRYFSINTAGTFWVEATNTQGCTARDTIVVTEIRPTPANFLPKEDSICRYENKTITAIGNFNSYTWQDGSPQQTITIREAGNYTLTVTDRYGCEATESIKIVQRDCLEGLFVPNAFTPNQDGQNDVFKPAVHASVVAYQLNIYNRWGELVFTTNNPMNGWDGKSRSLEQPQGVYIWQIKYHFTGGYPQIRKGTVMLSR